MYLYESLKQRAAHDQPVRVGLIGAGKFGSMFLSQVSHTPGLVVSRIADLAPQRVIDGLPSLGWSSSAIAAVKISDDVNDIFAANDVDVVVEATGHPVVGVKHARAAIAASKHLVMVNVEADVLAGAALSKLAEQAGTVYSMAYGDQPALTCEMIDWARSCGFNVVAAGKGTKYLPAYHASTPDTVWEHYGLTAEQAADAGMNSKMFNSFLDGTKSALEMAAIANASGLGVATGGLGFPPCGMDDLAAQLKPVDEGGVLERKGVVEVVSSLNRDGSEVERDLRWGVYVVIEAPNDYSAACFRQYGMNTDSSGRYSAMYKPFHLIGLELNMSILGAALAGRPTGSCRGFVADTVATAKQDLDEGTVLDGEGGYTVYGSLVSAADSLEKAALPIGLAQDVKLLKPVKAGEIIGYDQVTLDMTDPVVSFRRDMENSNQA